MQKAFVAFAVLAVAAMLLFGCTQAASQTGGDSMANKNDKNSGASLDANSPDRNATNFNNLDQYRKVKAGDKVSVHYVGRLTDGSIFDSSIGKDPLSFVAGAGQMIKGFDAAVIGMTVGEKKTVELPPEEAYGPSDPAKIVVLDANQFGDFSKIEVGMKVGSDSGLTGVIESKTDTNATVNFNMELAGKTLVFEIVLVSIS